MDINKGLTDKERRRLRVEHASSHKLLKRIAIAMDHYFLDPVIGFLFPGFGDFTALLLSIPYIWFSLTVVRSIPLTMAVMYNMLIDVLVGFIPVLGDILDIFDRSYWKNYLLITAFVEEDKATIIEVRKKALFFSIAVVLLLLIIGLLLFSLYKTFGWVATALLGLWEVIIAYF